MKNNNIKPAVEERIILPTVTEIKKNGISPELKAQLLNPNAKFNGDLEVYCSSCSVGDPGYGKTFTLSLNLRNATGGHRSNIVYSVDEARRESQRILSGNGCWAGGPGNGGIYRRKNREDLVDEINDRIRNHIRQGGEYINETVWNSTDRANDQGLDAVINCRIA